MPPGAAQSGGQWCSINRTVTMKSVSSITRVVSQEQSPAVRTSCATNLLALLLLLNMAAMVQAQFTFTTNNGAITITRYTGPGGVVTVPSQTNGLPITAIAACAFSNCTSVTSVTIPDGITNLGNGAFYSCTGLTNITTGNGITRIGTNTFYYCRSLPTVTLGSSVTSVDSQAFWTCYALGSITFPNSVTNIGTYAVASCNLLTNVVIGNGIARIQDNAFTGCSSLRSIYFLGNPPSLGLSVFPNNFMDTVYYYSGTTGWGQTFGGLPAVLLAPPFTCTTSNNTIIIKSYTGSGGAVTIPDTLNSLPVITIGSLAFNHCTNLTSVAIGTNVTSIGTQAFWYCTGLTNVTLPNSVTSIGGAAFSGCGSLTTITVPASLTSIGGSAFSGCTSLTAITVDALNPNYSSAEGALFDKSQATLILCPGGKVGTYTVPAGVTNIAGGAFDACPSLTAIAVEALNTNYSSADGVLFNKGQSTLIQYPQGKVGSYGVPGSVTSIRASAFINCPGLTSVTIPAGLTNIGDSAFWWCNGLAAVYFQGNAPTLGGGNVFYHDTNTIYYLPGTLGWGTNCGGRPTMQWYLPNPVILNDGPSFGVQTNRFGFIISWATNLSVVVEACTNLTNPVWSPASTNALADGWSSFSDPAWMNYPARFYRITSP
jgi:hypothetical protein